MNYTVEIRDSEGLVGRITLTSDNRFVLEPPDSRVLQRILTEPIWVMGAGGTDDVYSNKEPNRFIQNLYKHYKSYALGATRATNGSSEPIKGGAPFADDLPARPPPRRRTDLQRSSEGAQTPPPPEPPSLPPARPAPPPSPPPTPHAPPIPHQGGGPGVQRRYGLRPGPGWRSGGRSREGVPIWLWGPHERQAAAEEEATPPPPPVVTPPVPVQQPPAPAPLPVPPVQQPPAPPLIQPPPAPGATNAGPTQPRPDGRGAGGGGSEANVGVTDTSGREVAATPTRPSDSVPGQVGQAESAPPGAETTGAGPKYTDEDIERRDKIAYKFYKAANFFRRHNAEWAADWSEELQDYINETEPEDLFDEWYDRPTGGDPSTVAFKGTGVFDEEEDKETTEFLEYYLPKNGIMFQTGDVPYPDLRTIRSAPLPEEDEHGNAPQPKEGDYVPAWTNLADKLEELKLLPGLETSEDIDVLMGAIPSLPKDRTHTPPKITKVTPDVVAKFDEKYGKDGWLIKPYGDEAYAAFGIFFPPRVRALQKTAKTIVSATHNKLGKYGFTMVRDRDTKEVIGVADTNSNNKMYLFANEKGLASIPNDEVKTLTYQLKHHAAEESGAKLPLSAEDDLQNETGLRIKWSNEVDEDGKRKALAVVRPTGQELPLSGPVYQRLLHSFGDEDSVDYFNGMIWRALQSNGIQPKLRYSVVPAFPAVGVSEQDRAAGRILGASEGRVHMTTRNGEVTKVPFATLDSKSATVPIVFPDANIRAMEDAAEAAIRSGPHSERDGQTYAADMLLAEDGWHMVERNSSVPTGTSEWLEQNAFVIDAYTSHIMGREPLHARFIRKLLKDKRKQQNLNEHHAQVISKFDTAIKDSGLDQAQADTYRSAFTSAMRIMPTEAHRRLSEDMRSLTIVASPDQLAGKLKTQILSVLDQPNAEEQIISDLTSRARQAGVFTPKQEKFWREHPDIKGAYRRVVDVWFDPKKLPNALALYKNGHVVIDGLGDEKEVQSAVDYYKIRPGAGETPSQALHRHLIAHELTHVIDGARAEYSNDPAWKSAYEEELKGQQLTDYGGESPVEAFAEFGARIYGGVLEGHGELLQQFPKAVAFFKSKGLWV